MTNEDPHSDPVVVEGPEDAGLADVELAEAPLPPPAPQLPSTPTAPSERVDTIDIVRGLALFGILAANMRGFAGPAASYFRPHLMWPEFHDRLAQAFVNTFIQGKFIAIFALLFGVGFTAQLTRAQARGTKFGWRYVRRLLILAAFGIAHGLLIWFGDILLVYAVTGFLLLLFRKRTNKTLVTWFLILMLTPIVIGAGVFSFFHFSGRPMPGGPPGMNKKPDIPKLVQIYGDGSFTEVQQQRAKDAVMNNWRFYPAYGNQILAMFLLGVLAWRKGFFTPQPESLPRYRRAMWWALFVGASCEITAAVLRWFVDSPRNQPSGTGMLLGLITLFSTPVLSFGYVCAIILACYNVKWRPRLSRFGAIGRMALTNYLLQSIIGTLLFYGYGLSLMGQAGPALLIIPTILIFAVQAVASPWWLERYQFGPAEWVWRSLTYGKPQPMRREAVQAPKEPEALA